MKKTSLLIIVLSIITTFDGTAQQEDEQFPYLYELIEAYAADNFEYPVHMDEILAYWRVYKRSPQVRSILTDPTIEWLDSVTFERLCRRPNELNLAISESGDYFVFLQRDTLLFLPAIDCCNPLSGYASLDRRNMRNFLRVSMQRSDSSGYSIATEEMQHRFNKGLYDMVAVLQPRFRENRRERKAFHATVLVFEEGRLTSKCRSENMKPHMLPCYDSVQEYVAAFAEEYDLSRIIFYYIYD